jgi:acetoin utilization deacetylase AcuC-like enzyme
MFDDNTSDDEFLKIISTVIPKFWSSKPDFIFYLAGVDILASDKLSKLNCSLQGCKKREIGFRILFTIPNSKFQWVVATLLI